MDFRQEVPRPLIAFVLVAASLTSWSPPVQAKMHLKSIEFKKGDDKENLITQPVVDGSSIPPLAIGEFRFDETPGQDFYRYRSKFTGRNYGIAPEFDLGKEFSAAMKREAAAMGFRLGPSGWTVSGKLEEFFYDLKLTSGGFAGYTFGYLTIRIDLAAPDGASSKERYRVYFLTKGGGEKVIWTLPRILIEDSQEVLSRLNAEHFHAPPAPGIAKLVQEVQKRFHTGKVNMIGLSGSPEAASALLKLLATDDDNDERFTFLMALTRLAPRKAVPLVASRYRDEDEDLRWVSLRLFSNANTPESLKLVHDLGLSDKWKPCRDLAEHILAGR